jgi:cellulose synthase/poly-beta-1,6-N-acetylglucosamine synthase-like glycosyltransferase
MERPIVRGFFWGATALLTWTQAGYGVALAALRRLRGDPPVAPAGDVGTPRVSLIVAAHSEQRVIAAKVADALALDWPRDRLEIVVAVDGGAEPGADATAERARAAGADVVLELPRAGKVRAQDAAVAAASGDLLAFSDANATWEPDALHALLAPFADPQVGYVCGQVRFVNEQGTNQEGLYWRYEMWLRAGESALASVTAGNGAIYALRREAYMHVDAVMGHDLSFPFNVVKRGRRAVYAPDARASEKMVPSIEARGRPQASHDEPRLGDRAARGMLSPRGYPPLYALMIASHRVLRYASPLLHLPWPGRRSRCCGRAVPTAWRRSPRPDCSRRRRPAAACASGPRCSRATTWRRRRTRGRALRPSAPRDDAGVGGRGGHAGELPLQAPARRHVASGMHGASAPGLGGCSALDPARESRPPDLSPTARGS